MFVQWLRENKVARWLLTILRIWVGWQFLTAGWEKIGNTTWVGSQAGVSVAKFLQHSLTLAGGEHPAVQGWYAAFIRGFALPHAKLFSYLVAYGEVLVGIALILGAFTTFAALMGIIMNFSYLFAGTTSTNPNMVLEQMFLLIAGFNAAVYGLDYWIIPYLRKLWRKGKDRGIDISLGGKGKVKV